MIKISSIICLQLILFGIITCNPIHERLLDTTFIQEFNEALLSNITDLIGSNSYADKVGNWHWDSQRDIDYCKDGIAKTMWLVSLPYIRLGNHELSWPDHRAIWLNIDCGDRVIPFTVDFSESKGARRRFGYFDHDKMVLRGPHTVYLPVQTIYQATETKYDYNLITYNCHHYSVEMYDKLLMIGQTLL